MDINLDYAGMVWLAETLRRIEANPPQSADELDEVLAQVSDDLTARLNQGLFGD